MSTTLFLLQRFFHSHHFLGGLRQGVGVLIPALVLAGLLDMYATGFVAAVGAACVAILDQPGGPRRYGLNGMLAALFLGSMTTAITGLASGSMLIWLVVPALCFGFSMLTVYGKHGGLLGFACLLIMTLTMRTPLSTADVMQHTLTSFLGGAFYLAYSSLAHRILWHREEQQILSTALFATADYIGTRARFYDIQLDLDESYRYLIRNQAAMTDAHQEARDMVLRELPRGTGSYSDRLRQGLLNLFADMVRLLDSMVASQTDYESLRKELGDSDILLFMRDTLAKLAHNVAGIALNLARNQKTRVRNSAKAELRAIEFELQQLREQGLPADKPELYALLVQVLRRLRNMANRVESMAAHAENPAFSSDIQDTNKTLNRFLTRQKWRLGMLVRNLNLESAHCRYALRVAVAAVLAMTVGSILSVALEFQGLDSNLAGHRYWIVLTVLVIMKPGFALTRMRNGWRLSGTLIGCGLAMLLFALVQSNAVLMLTLFMCIILGFSLVQVNYMLSAMCNTLMVLLVFHFLVPGTEGVVAERLLDTFLGSVLALACSYILPSWERNTMSGMAQELRQASMDFLRKGMTHARVSRLARLDARSHEHELKESETGWKLSRKQVHIAFSNFASAFYRMMDEPVRRQRHVQELNRLMIHHHTLASQIAAVIPQLCRLDEVPGGIAQALEATDSYLEGRPATAPGTLETDGDYAALAYPLRQMIKAAQGIDTEMKAIEPQEPDPAGKHMRRITDMYATKKT